MNILVVGSEAAPFARTGGLGDVLGALPSALAKAGHDVKLFIPWYGAINTKINKLTPLECNASVSINGENHPVKLAVVKNRRSSAECFFVGNDRLFSRPGIYSDPESGDDFDDNDRRFTFFNRAVLQLVKELDFRPDVIHCHDWQAGLIPALLKTEYAYDEFFAYTRTLFTIHNLAYQGLFEAKRFINVGLPEELMAPTGPFEFYGKVNFLKAAVVFSDKISTVSPQYAQEIQTNSELGCGLEGVLQTRTDDISGILNGVDYTVWSPSRDRKIPHKYHKANLSGKRMCKVELIRTIGLPLRDKTPLIGMIARLVDQKGLDLIAQAAKELFSLDIQMVVLGTGDNKHHEMLTKLQELFPDKIRAFFEFDDRLAHQIEAGADMFLMPSRFEPCGLNQMYSLKYGTVPIVRRIGGLADTVTDYDERTGQGTGFVFDTYSAEAMMIAISRAVDLFAKRRVWMKLMKAGMACDFSWDKAASHYLSLFEQTTGQTTNDPVS